MIINKLPNIRINDQRPALGWVAYCDLHGNILVMAFPDDERDESKLSFPNDVRDIVPFAAALHDVYVTSVEGIEFIAETVRRELDVRGY